MGYACSGGIQIQRTDSNQQRQSPEPLHFRKEKSEDDLWKERLPFQSPRPPKTVERREAKFNDPWAHRNPAQSPRTVLPSSIYLNGGRFASSNFTERKNEEDLGELSPKSPRNLITNPSKCDYSSSRR